MISPELARGLTRVGCKVQCPFCEKRLMSQMYQPFHQSGIGQHIKIVHPEEYDNVVNQSEAFERQAKEKKLQQEKDEREQPLRKHVVSGSLLMDIVGNLESLMGMMEPYYSQCDADSEALELVQRLEGIIASKGL